jgi:hypothetical protein
MLSLTLGSYDGNVIMIGSKTGDREINFLVAQMLVMWVLMMVVEMMVLLMVLTSVALKQQN